MKPKQFAHIHTYFHKRYPNDYTAPDILIIAPWLLKQLGVAVTGDPLPLLRTHWGEAVEWLREWEGY